MTATADPATRALTIFECDAYWANDTLWLPESAVYAHGDATEAAWPVGFTAPDPASDGQIIVAATGTVHAVVHVATLVFEPDIPEAQRVLDGGPVPMYANLVKLFDESQTGLPGETFACATSDRTVAVYAARAAFTRG